MNNNEFIKNPHLDGDDFFMPGNSTGVLLIHGFSATTTEVRLMADKLHQAGFTTAGPLLPGHGTHPEDLNRTKWPMWVEKVKHTYESMLRDCQQIFVIGESVGSVLAIELAVQHPEIPGLMLFAPAIKARKAWISGIARFFIPYYKKNYKDDGLPWKGYNVYPIKGAHQMVLLQKHCRKILPKITQPTHIFTGGLDHSIAPDSARIILENISSNYKCHTHFPNSPHCILLDRDLDQAASEVISFINRTGK